MATENNPTAGEYMTSQEAAEALGISPATLYAYVSRGLVRSEPAPGSKRARRYRAEDVRGLQARQEARADPGVAVESALNWGMPVLESGITLIDGGRPYYRGHDVLELVETHCFEEVVGLLWTGRLGAVTPDPPPDDVESPYEPEHDFVGWIQQRLVNLAMEDPAAYDFQPRSLRQSGAAVLGVAAEALAGTMTADSVDLVAEMLQQRWAPDIEEVTRLFDAALILSADHELNISSFTARCIASARAPLYSAVTGGLAAFQGARHGGMTLRVEALFDEVARVGDARAVLAGRLRRGDQIHGFGHRLYPDGDPRGRLLIDLIAETLGGEPVVGRGLQIIAIGREVLGREPSLDFALVMLANAVSAPAGFALGLMALGRSAGWVAHALEEYERDRLIRPRARYTGVMPSTP